MWAASEGWARGGTAFLLRAAAALRAWQVHSHIPLDITLRTYGSIAAGKASGDVAFLNQQGKIYDSSGKKIADALSKYDPALMGPGALPTPHGLPSMPQLEKPKKKRKPGSGRPKGSKDKKPRKRRKKAEIAQMRAAVARAAALAGVGSAMVPGLPGVPGLALGTGVGLGTGLGAGLPPGLPVGGVGVGGVTGVRAHGQ